MLRPKYLYFELESLGLWASGLWAYASEDRPELIGFRPLSGANPKPVSLDQEFTFTMNIMAMAIALIDNGGRRLGVDRRQFSYTDYIPDKRLDDDRRTVFDRRSVLHRRDEIDRRRDKVIILKNGKDLREGRDRRSSIERRATFAAALSSWYYRYNFHLIKKGRD